MDSVADAHAITPLAVKCGSSYTILFRSSEVGLSALGANSSSRDMADAQSSGNLAGVRKTCDYKYWIAPHP